MTTKHNHQVIFGRKEDGCPRCFELKMGAPAVQGWGAMRKAAERMRCEAIRKHNCQVSRCGPVCTAFDW